MTALSGSQVTALRSHPHRLKTFLTVCVPNQVLLAQVNDGAIERGEQTVTYDNASPPGGYVNVRVGTTLYVGTAQGAQDKGRVRIKAIDATTITVAENMHIDWADDDYLMVGDTHEPWGIFPRVLPDEDAGDITIWQDYDIAYTDQNENYPPVAIMGAPAVGFLSGGTVSFYFDGSDSYALNGASISSYAWVFPSGTPATSAVATPGNVAWTVSGSYWVSLTVTDDNGKTHTGWRWVRVFAGEDPEDGFWPYTQFEVLELTGDYRTGGWRATFAVRDQSGRLTETYFWDNAQVCLFATGTAQNGATLPISANHPHRQNLLFVGWLVGESVRRDPLTNDVTFEAVGITERMRLIEAFPDTFEVPLDEGAPDNWYEAENLDIDLCLAAHLKWRSTVFEVVDVFLPMTNGVPVGYGGTPWALYKIMRQDFMHGNLYDQCNGFLEDAMARMFSDKQSTIWCRIDPQVYPTPYRTLLPTIWTLTDQDWRDLQDILRRTLDDVSQIDLAGVYYDGLGVDPDVNVQPILSLAPGNTPRYEGQMVRVEGQILGGQLNANVLSGDILGWRNNPFPSITMLMAGAWTCLDFAPPEWIVWTLAAADTKRGISWTSARFIPRAVTLEIDNSEGNCRVHLEVEKEADGEDGVDGNYPPTEPTEPTGPSPDGPPPVPPTPPTPGAPTGGAWRKCVLACGSGGPWYTTNFVTNGGPGGTPTWVNKIGGMGADIDCICLAFHPIEPDVTHYVCTANNVYRRQPGVSDNWVVVLTAAAAAAACGRGGAGCQEFQSIQTSPVYPGYLYAIFNAGCTASSPTVYCLRSTDLGATWAMIGTVQAGIYGPPTYCSQLQIEQTVGVVMYIEVYNSVTGTKLRYSGDGGVTWTERGWADPQSYRQTCICHADGSLCFTHDTQDAVERVYFFTNYGANMASVADQGGWYPLVYSNQPGKHVFNSQRVHPGLVRCSNGYYMYTSLDYGVTWARTQVHASCMQNPNIEVIPDAPSKLYLHRTGGTAPTNVVVQATQDEGATIYEKSGAITGSITDLTPIWTLP